RADVDGGLGPRRDDGAGARSTATRGTHGIDAGVARPACVGGKIKAMSTTRTQTSLMDPLSLRRSHDDAVPSNGAVGPATPNRHRNSNHDWEFPFASPGRFKTRTIKPNTERRMPFVDMDAVDDVKIEPRFVRSAVTWQEFRARVLEYADDVGVVSIDDPALAHEFDEIRYIYPHARSLIVLIAEENKPSLQSRYLPTANHELYECEERLFHWN